MPNSEPTVGVSSRSRLMVNTFEIDLDFVASVNVTFAVMLVSDLSLKLVLIVCVPPSL